MSPSIWRSDRTCCRCARFICLNEIHLIALQLDGQARILDIPKHRFPGAGGPVSQRRSLVDGGEERIPEKLDVSGIADEERADGDEAGKIPVLGSQPVPDPRSHGRTNQPGVAGVQLPCRGGMSFVVRLHGPEQAQLVGVLRHVGQPIGHHHPGLSPGPHRGDRSHQAAQVHPDAVRDLVGNGLAALFRQPRLVVEHVELGRAARHPHEDHPLGAGLKMRNLWRQGAGGGRSLLGAHGGQRHGAETASGGLQETAARQVSVRWEVHGDHPRKRNSLDANTE